MKIFTVHLLKEDWKKSLEKGVFHLLVSMGFSQGFLFILGIAVARLLGPVDFGHLRVINAVLLLAAIPATMGMPAAIVKHVAEATQVEEKHRVLSLGISFGILTALIVSTGLFMVLEYSTLIDDVVARTYLRVICWVLPLTVTSENIISYFQGRKQIKRMAFWNVILAFARMILLIAFTRTFLLPGYIGGRWVYECLACAALALQIRKAFRLGWDPLLFRRMFRLGSFACLGLAFATLTMTIDTLCLSAILKDPALVGQYGIAVTMAMGLLLFPKAISQSALPYLAEKCRDPERVKRLFIYLILRVGIIMLIIGGIAYLAAPDLIRILYGPDYLAAVGPFRILIVGIFIYSLHNISGTTLLAMGRTDLNFYVALIGGSLNIVLNIVLIHQYGLIGAAYATTITFTLRMTISIILLFQQLRKRSP